MTSGIGNSGQHSKALIDIGNSHDNPLLLKKTTKERPQTYQLKPSSVLNDVRAFLPKIAKANQVMNEQLKTDPNKFDIEAEENGDGPVIEMNMSLVLQEGVDSSEESDSSDDTNSDSDQCFGEVTEENFRITKKNASNKCLIQEVTDEKLDCDEKT